MRRYYTSACNFFYGKNSLNLIKKKATLPLIGRGDISFSHIKLITRKSENIISINKIKSLPKKIKQQVKKDLINITNKRKNFCNLNFNRTNIMGVLNLTPDSFSDGGKFNNFVSGYRQVLNLKKLGADIIDVGGESTRPGSKTVPIAEEWNRIQKILNKIKYLNTSLDTRKSLIMEKGIKSKVNLINDVSGLDFDENSINVLKKYKTPFVLQHSQGNPENMQEKPKYKNVILDIYDFFENKIERLKKFGINHNKIIIDPGIGFGKNLKHNLLILRNISLFHSIGFPILLGISRKRFIKDISGINDSKDRLGGTISASLHGILNGIQILRVHDVNEVKQSIKVFKQLL
ncbi:dihydropteroate synthase [Candidatus Pelagibacter sp.]|uniref:dihydropteroate synthase n=1 Tax=Candidatus Pelagibacter sp. TaxID=2024849 RepID=UPI003F86C914